MNFLKETISKKKWLIFLSLVGIFFLILPRPAFAQGLVERWIVNAVLLLPYALVGVILLFCIFLTQGLALLMGSLLNFVTGPNFISFSYTNPATNPIIEIGLGITKSFVNMGLVVVLIFIALSITLRLNETEAKKAFTRLIIIALLVNFAPVICGLIVDAANIVMNYFIVGIEKGVSGILSQITDFGSALWDGLKDFRDLGQGKLGIVTQGIFQILLNLNIAFVFFLFALLFIFRYLAIWVLVILSPIAFVAWILPASKRIWDIWWEQLIQWSIIGIPLAFFLYLGMRVFEGLSGAYTGKLAGVDPTLSGFFDKIFPYFIVLSFLYLGFLYGLQTSALGSAAVMRGARAARRRGGAQIRRTLRDIGRGTIVTTAATAGLIGRTARRFPRGIQRGGGWGSLGGWREGFRELGKGIVPPRRAAYRLWRMRARAGTRIAIATGRGFLNAIGDIARTGWRAAMRPPRGPPGGT